LSGVLLSKEEQLTLKTYRELVAWQKAMELAEAVYDCTRSFPKDELYGLTSQMRRAAVSVPSNIAEGQGRVTPNELIHHLRIAYGSLSELETQLILAERLTYLDHEAAKYLLDSTSEVGRLINGLMRSLR
jgi:four helix bundle protein